jgi:hypothetical protein
MIATMWDMIRTQAGCSRHFLVIFWNDKVSAEPRQGLSGRRFQNDFPFTFSPDGITPALII